MRIIKPSVEILPQGYGVEGMFRLIERVGRIAYKSEDRITLDSYKKFIDMLYDRGHWAVFNLGTVYLIVPNSEINLPHELFSQPYSSYVKYSVKNGNYYITTNYRVICQLRLYEFMNKYWSDPTEYHYHRVVTRWVCSRGIGNELVRHRLFSFIQESTR